MTRVEVTGCSDPDLWYSDYIGHVFRVVYFEDDDGELSSELNAYVFSPDEVIAYILHGDYVEL